MNKKDFSIFLKYSFWEVRTQFASLIISQFIYLVQNNNENSSKIEKYTMFIENLLNTQENKLIVRTNFAVRNLNNFKEFK